MQAVFPFSYIATAIFAGKTDKAYQSFLKLDPLEIRNFAWWAVQHDYREVIQFLHDENQIDSDFSLKLEMEAAICGSMATAARLAYLRRADATFLWRASHAEFPEDPFHRHYKSYKTLAPPPPPPATVDDGSSSRCHVQ